MSHVVPKPALERSVDRLAHAASDQLPMSKGNVGFGLDTMPHVCFGLKDQTVFFTLTACCLSAPNFAWCGRKLSHACEMSHALSDQKKRSKV